MNLPLVDVNGQNASVGDALRAALTRVVAHGRFIDGPEVSEFEDVFAGFCGTRYCVGTASGTSAIELVLRAADIGPGDEVVTTPFTFIATVAPILLVGARPVFADVDVRTGLIDLEAVEAALTTRTAAIIPVHLYGQTVDLEAVSALADRHKLLLLEDAAQAHGARWLDRRAGSVGDASAFSFYPGKNLGAFGDAGCVTTDDETLAARIRKLRDHGRRDHYCHDDIGTNARIDTIQAAVLAAKLPYLERWNEARRRHAKAYDVAFAHVPGVESIFVADGALPTYHQYVVRLSEREVVRNALAQTGIATGIHYPIPLHRQPALEGIVSGELPAADRLAAEVLSLPVFPELSDEERDFVRETLLAAVEGPPISPAAAR
jgi:dTDP-4-amino-4,6-dideoxygalactose transaminase